MSGSATLSNAEIADRLSSLAQLLTVKGDNPYKIRAYRRAAATIRGLGESVDELVRNEGDLTTYEGIGKAIAFAVREIVLEGKLGSLEKLRAEVPPEVVAINQHPRLDAKRVLRVYKKLGLSSIEELRKALDSGQIDEVFGARMAQHIRQGLIESSAILLYHAHSLVAAIQHFLLKKCGVARAIATGDYRRCVEVISSLDFLVETTDFRDAVEAFQKFGGRTPMLELTAKAATFSLPAGPMLRLEPAFRNHWGLALIRRTGSKTHLSKLTRVTGSLSALDRTRQFSTEEEFYKEFGLQFIPPELREGRDEMRLARERKLPALITQEDLRGDLHMHTEASDGIATLEQMALAAKSRKYAYVGISDHSPSLKIANGLSVERLKEQIRAIDKLNEKLTGIRILKSAEVDILADGTLDYPDEILRELDYTVCSIHSRFGMNKEQQTERVLRAMDNRYFNILGHATGRLLLKRPGYEIDVERVIAHAKENCCFFELNSSPDRLDVSAENARMIREAGVLIAISTDSHSTGELATIRYGLEQARRAGLEKAAVLNTRSLSEILKLFAR
ncbi:DNA polymerase/3'-5' exonuclease PolX [Occallatibacter savannae]|uniref:DNA polymerase/3'-5' exonuclease PolX n=1 Tax=Occallatibacter savannae TaxID=1002691 RepID=UPI0013A595CD|nr:DNA polymerase/3'-5' exonuclease PolX [Occallatibacter savannae]